MTKKPAIAYTNAAGAVQYIAANAIGFARPVTVSKVASNTISLAFGSGGPAVGFVNAVTGKVDLSQVTGKTFITNPIATVSTTGATGAQVLINPTTKLPEVVYHDSTGVYIAAPSTNGGGTFQLTQVQTGGTNTIAAVQPGSGTIVFSTVSTTGGILRV